MSRFPIEIEKYMSSVVVVIDPQQTLAEAVRLMRLHRIRHLPVLAHGRLVGLVSQRDVYLMESFDRTDPSQILVKEAMSSSPYTVDPEEPIDVVAREMARRKIGSALVAHGGRLLGLFTATDALQALAALVEDERVPGEEIVVEAAAKPPARKKAKRLSR